MSYYGKLKNYQKRIGKLQLAMEDLSEHLAGHLGKPRINEAKLKRAYHDIRKLQLNLMKEFNKFFDL